MKKYFAVFCIVSNLIVCVLSILGTYNVVKPKIITNSNIGSFYTGQYLTEDVPKCKDIKITVPINSGEFLNGIGVYYDLVAGPDYTSDEGVLWNDNKKFLKTPYEYSHWTLGYTDDGVPVVVKYSTDTLISTKWNRRATCSDLFHDFYGPDKVFYLSGDLYKTSVTLKYVGQIFNEEDRKNINNMIHTNIASLSELSPNSRVDNYMGEGRNVPCVLIYCDKIIN